MPKTQKTQKTVNKQELYSPDDLIFALDIGTRTVVGIVGFYEKDIFKVVAAEVYEHKSRAMLDGQIHDIEKVAEVVSEVRHRLEQALGLSLSKVAIAAAGRVLRTSQFKLEYEIEQGREITAEIVGSLEVDAIQNAQMKLDSEFIEEEKVPFYCVGYSVVNYFLNGYVISSLVGHKGKKIGVEILATFLPHIVVDSLYTVMSKVGLEVSSLTLEPIAAISVTIPKDLRLLNLVLVDIGAGTSDIAITKDGSVVAYGMVPVAGDEITEKIAQEFLVDFNTAERIKISISSATENIKYTDILGKKYEATRSRVLELIQPAVDNLASSISSKILEFNLKTPNAVFLIGGGSQIPGLTERIADGLGLQTERVAVRGRDIIHNIKTKIKKLSGPESITPFGIAMMAHNQSGHDFMSVTVNGERIKLFNSKKLTIADTLILVGYNPDTLIGRSGKSLKFKLNGKPVTVRGEFGTAAEIFLNNKPASLDTGINIGDFIDVKPAKNGKDAVKYIADYVKTPDGLSITVNNDKINLVPVVTVNGETKTTWTQIKEDDVVHIDEIVTLSDLVAKHKLELKGFELFVNGQSKSLDYILANNDHIEHFCNQDKKTDNSVNKIVENSVNNSIENCIDNNINMKTEDRSEFVITVNDQRVALSRDKSYIFVDIFSYINFDLTKPQGNIVLKLNGRPANFTDNISEGDLIQIYWENFKA